jgi:hypothetical protein
VRALPKTLGWTSGRISDESADCTPSPLATNALLLTPSSVPSFLAPASGRSGRLAFGGKGSLGEPCDQDTRSRLMPATTTPQIDNGVYDRMADIMKP